MLGKLPRLAGLACIAVLAACAGAGAVPDPGTMSSSASSSSSSSGGLGGSPPAAPECAFSVSYGDGADQDALSIAVGSDDSIAVAGVFRGTVDFGGGPITSTVTDPSSLVIEGDVFVLKLDANGQYRFVRRVAGNDATVRVAAGAGGAVVVAVGSQGSVDLGGGPIQTTVPYDTVVAALDAGGNLLWSTPVGADGADAAYVADLVTDRHGNAYVSTFEFAGEHRYAVFTKVDGAGKVVWRRAIQSDTGFLTGSSSHNSAVSYDGKLAWSIGVMPVGVDATLTTEAGELVVPLGAIDAFLLELDESGTVVRQRLMDVSGGAANHALALPALAYTQGEALVAVVKVEGEADLGLGTVQSAADPEVGVQSFLVGFGPDLGTAWASPMSGVSVEGIVPLPDNQIGISGIYYGAFDMGTGPLGGDGQRGAFVARTSATGEVLAARAYGPGVGGSWVLARSSDGSMVTAGELDDVLSFCDHDLEGAGGRDFYVAKVKF
jgi:hypothetical protein